MATSTFDKRIIIDDAAADVLIELLKEPAPPRCKQNIPRAYRGGYRMLSAKSLGTLIETELAEAVTEKQ
jgi:hypothetical protein